MPFVTAPFTLKLSSWPRPASTMIVDIWACRSSFCSLIFWLCSRICVFCSVIWRFCSVIWAFFERTTPMKTAMTAMITPRRAIRRLVFARRSLCQSASNGQPIRAE